MLAPGLLRAEGVLDTALDSHRAHPTKYITSSLTLLACPPACRHASLTWLGSLNPDALNLFPSP